tara:strand:- start:840 stop:1745 length:906 start_codon:yes stop_codon:yes gene_type:complete
MTTKINGTNTAASPAITGADTDTGLSFGTDTVNINTGGVTRATVDSSGRVLINTTTTSQTHKLQVEADSNANAIAIFGRSADDIGDLSFYENDATTKLGEIQYRQDHANIRHRVGYLAFATGGTTERMRIDSSGRVLLNTSSSFDNEYRMSTYITSTGGHVFRPDGTSTRKPLAFQNNSGSEVGSISSSTSSTSFNTSSDYRLKENVTAISDGITRLKTLKPSRFNFKTEKDRTVDGFLAHEVTAVPEAITGTKDEVDSDNNPVYQGIDQSKLVPLLTAALQEAVAKIEVLETKVAALEAA